MYRTFLKSKIHRVTATEANLDYEGSVSIDEDLMQRADILPFEQVDIYNITNGQRLTTYAIPAEPGSGTICSNGAAAHHVQPGHLLIIASYVALPEDSHNTHQPRLVLVDQDNRPQDGPSTATSTV